MSTNLNSVGGIHVLAGNDDPSASARIHIPCNRMVIWPILIN
jgi:hypothetical protein